MSYSLQDDITPEEDAEFENLYYSKKKGDMRDYLKDGQPMNAKHARWLLERERKERKARTDTAGFHSPSPFWTGVQEPTVSSSQTLEPIPALLRAREVASPDGEFTWPNKLSEKIGGTKMSLVKVGPATNKGAEAWDFCCDIQIHSRKTGWEPLKGIVDTGARENWVSRRVVDRLNLPVKYGLRREGEVLRGFDGCRVESDATVEPRWCIDGQNLTHITVFRVANSDSVPFEVLFGRNLYISGSIDFYSKENPVQVLVSTKESKEESAEIARNEATAQAIRAQLDEKPKQVNRRSAEKKSSRGKGRTQKPKEASE